MINVVDVSSVLHTARNIPGYDAKIVSSFNVGGIRHLMRMVTTFLAKNEGVVLCFDKGQNPRKSISTEYKSNRKLATDVKLQSDLLIEKLQSMGIPCYFGEAESDDYIAKFCSCMRGENDYVTVYSADKDLYANVSYNIFYNTVNTNTKNVTPLNFVQAVSPKDCEIPFNMILPYKVFLGDSSDCVKPLPNGKELFEGYKKFCLEFGVTDGDLVGSLDILNIYLDTIELNNEEMHLRIKLIYPWEVNEEMVPVYSRDVDMDKMQKFLCVIRDRVSLKNLKMEFIPSDTRETDELYKLGQSLLKGEYAVDNNLPLFEVNFDSIDDDVFNVKEL